MSQSNHHGKQQPLTQNQNNRMSDDPGDGSRNAGTPGREGAEPEHRSPEEKAQYEGETVDAFGDDGGDGGGE